MQFSAYRSVYSKLSYDYTMVDASGNPMAPPPLRVSQEELDHVANEQLGTGHVEDLPNGPALALDSGYLLYVKGNHLDNSERGKVAMALRRAYAGVNAGIISI